MLDIIYEDEDILAINKPFGVAVHGDGKNDFETMADFILKNYPNLENVGEDFVVEGKVMKKPGIVHRLDKDTSGVLIVVKNQDSFNYYKNLFQKREIQKEYHAICYGWPKEQKGIIDATIARSKGDIRKWTAVPKAKRDKEREALTEYEVISYFSENEDRVFENKGSTVDGDFSYIKLKPKTGRTHQLRVHLKSINHPIICDTLYSKNIPSLGFERLALHARSIRFVDQKGEMREIIASFPPDFQNAREIMQIEDEFVQ